MLPKWKMNLLCQLREKNVKIHQWWVPTLRFYLPNQIKNCPVDSESEVEDKIVQGTVPWYWTRKDRVAIEVIKHTNLPSCTTARCSIKQIKSRKKKKTIDTTKPITIFPCIIYLNREFSQSRLYLTFNSAFTFKINIFLSLSWEQGIPCFIFEILRDLLFNYICF